MGIDMTWRKNLEHMAFQRTYFSDLQFKPVRAELRKKLADNAERKQEQKDKERQDRMGQQWSQPFSSHPLDGEEAPDTGGEEAGEQADSPGADVQSKKRVLTSTV